MQIGRLRDLCRIEWSTRNDHGEIVNWYEVAMAWMDVRAVKFEELIAGSQAESGFVTHRIWCRYISGIRTNMRVIWNPDGPIGPVNRLLETDRALEIQQINYDARKRWIELRCIELELVTT